MNKNGKVSVLMAAFALLACFCFIDYDNCGHEQQDPRPLLLPGDGINTHSNFFGDPVYSETFIPSALVISIEYPPKGS